MGLFDIHSHILHGVDDGSRSLQMSLDILEMMKKQGITDVMATPHFDACSESIEDFNEKVNTALTELNSATKGLDLPNVHIGCEVYYFGGIGKSYGIRNLTLAGSDYLLLELPFTTIDDNIIKDINNLCSTVGVIPIIAHIERYHRFKGFKKILKLIEAGEVFAQVNAPSILDSHFRRITKKLIKKGYVSYIATDSHSTDKRPPMMEQALNEIERLFGKTQRNIIVKNLNNLYNNIFSK